MPRLYDYAHTNDTPHNWGHAGLPGLLPQSFIYRSVEQQKIVVKLGQLSSLSCHSNHFLLTGNVGTPLQHRDTAHGSRPPAVRVQMVQQLLSRIYPVWPAARPVTMWSRSGPKPIRPVVAYGTCWPAHTPSGRAGRGSNTGRGASWSLSPSCADAPSGGSFCGYRSWCRTTHCDECSKKMITM
jgi:hypothetical protein